MLSLVRVKEGHQKHKNKTHINLIKYYNCSKKRQSLCLNGFLFSNLCLRVSCRDKINELHDWMRQLESEKFDHMERLKRQKYEVRAAMMIGNINIHCVYCLLFLPELLNLT